MPHKGQLIHFHEGGYSEGPFRALVDFSLTEACKLWCGTAPNPESGDARQRQVDLADLQQQTNFWPWEHHVGVFDFIMWLSTEGYIEDVECVDFQLGDLDLLHAPPSDRQGGWD